MCTGIAAVVLAYGEGVTYWALADMIRMRSRIAEDEPPDSALRKLRATLSEHLLDAGERSFVEPRLAQLLGLEEHRAADKADLFAAWRLFFERLADAFPTVLLFEDLQWADASLLDFVEYLLEWSRSSPLYVVTLARPELAERRPTWGAGHRNFTSLYLEPLSSQAMTLLLDGLVPGLPGELQEQILTRAEGVPLYAVETVRMLLDRGLLAQEGAAYRLTGEVVSLEVPETLHGLIAADSMDFRPTSAVCSRTAPSSARRSRCRVYPPFRGSRRRSSARCSEGSCVRRCSHSRPIRALPSKGSTASCRISCATSPTRRCRSASVALAISPQPSTSNARSPPRTRSRRCSRRTTCPLPRRRPTRPTLSRSGPRQRARFSGPRGEPSPLRPQARPPGIWSAPPRSRTTSVSAGACSTEAGWLAVYTSDYGLAERLLSESATVYETAGDTHSAARVSGRIAWVEWTTGRYDESLARAERAFEAVRDDEPDDDVGLLASILGAATSSAATSSALTST